MAMRRHNNAQEIQPKTESRRFEYAMCRCVVHLVTKYRYVIVVIKRNESKIVWQLEIVYLPDNHKTRDSGNQI